MIATDDDPLAWRERSKTGVLESLSHDARVCIMDADVKAPMSSRSAIDRVGLFQPQ